MWTWQITLHESDRTVVEALAARLPTAPRAYLNQLCRKGRVRLDEQHVSADSRVTAGRWLRLAHSDRLQDCIAASPLDPRAILFEDRDGLVVGKPAGLATHHGVGQADDLQKRVAAWFALRGERFRSAPAHRLDIGTSGPVLFGKGRAGIAGFGRLFMSSQVTKDYLALVHGTPAPKGCLLSPVPDRKRLRQAASTYTTLARAADKALLEVRLISGRRHQIRRQLADAGWPLLGDRRYAPAAMTGTLDHPFLHCHRLAFPTLDGRYRCTIEYALPAELRRLLDAWHILFDRLPETDTEIRATNGETGYTV